MSRRNNNQKTTIGQLFPFMPDSYLDRTSRPIYALTYLLGFVVLYELGTIFLNPSILDQSLTETRIVVSFVWIQSLLKFLGFSHRVTWIAAPFAVIVILLALQFTSRSRWYVRLGDFIPMTFECILLAVPLIVLSLLMNRPIQNESVSYETARSKVTYCQADVRQIDDSDTKLRLDGDVGTKLTSSTGGRGEALFADIVTGIGAGIYEELIFRLILICLLMLLFHDLFRMEQSTSVIMSVILASILFSAHHHIYLVYGEVRIGEPFTLVKFIFRALAGVYFAVLFAIRGFGVTAGCHIFYNVIATLLNSFQAG